MSVKPEPGITAKEFSKTNQEFKDACEKAGVQVTKRQASKFLRKFGRAYEALRSTKTEQ